MLSAMSTPACMIIVIIITNVMVIIIIIIIEMNMMMMIKVEDAVRAISNVDDYAGSAKALAATTLR